MQIRKELLTRIQNIIASTREAVFRSVNHQRVLKYWHISQKILEEEQHGKDQAEHGSYLLKFLFGERQLNSQRFERLLLSMDVASVLAVANIGHQTSNNKSKTFHDVERKAAEEI